MHIFSARTLTGTPADLEITVDKEGGVGAIIHIPTYTSPNATHTEVAVNDQLDEFFATLLEKHDLTFVNNMIRSQIAHVIEEESKAHSIGF